MSKKYGLLSKTAKGQQASDVANTAIRNILTLLSAEKKITEKEMLETEEFFEWKCPYTGVDLKERIQTRDGVALDHIVPQNREWCGLNVKGNLVWVDRKANLSKANKTVEEFLLNDNVFFADTPIEVRKERLKKIILFQNECGYNPDEIKGKIGDEIETTYNDTSERQNRLYKELDKILKS